MTYSRVLSRNRLQGNYGDNRCPPEAHQMHQAESSEVSSLLHPIRGDLRRLEEDQRDFHHLRRYAIFAGITRAQARLVLDAFLCSVPLPYPDPSEASIVDSNDSTEDGVLAALEQCDRALAAIPHGSGAMDSEGRMTWQWMSQYWNFLELAAEARTSIKRALKKGDPS